MNPWTKNAPTELGWYWCAMGNNDRPEGVTACQIVKIIAPSPSTPPQPVTEVMCLVTGYPLLININSVEWWGPQIPHPPVYMPDTGV